MPIERKPSEGVKAPLDWDESALDPWVAEQIDESRARLVAKIKAKPKRERTTREKAVLNYHYAERRRRANEANLSRDEKYRLWLARQGKTFAPTPDENPLVRAAIAKARETEPTRDEINAERYGNTDPELILGPLPGAETPFAPTTSRPATEIAFVEPVMRPRRSRLTITRIDDDLDDDDD